MTWSPPRGERRPSRPPVPGRRRARLHRRRSRSPACGVVALPVARRREPRRSLPGAWPPDARSSLPASEWARSRENERPAWHASRRRQVTSRARRTVWTVISEATCQPTIMHLVASTNTDVGHPFGGADGGLVRDSARVRTFRVKDPVNEVRGDVGTTASLSSSPLGGARRPKSRTLP